MRTLFLAACLSFLQLQVAAEDVKFEYADFTSVKLKSSAPMESLQLTALPSTELGANSVYVAVNDAGSFLVSGSSDGHVILWKRDGDKPWQKSTVITATKSSPMAHRPGPVIVDIYPNFPGFLQLGSIGFDMRPVKKVDDDDKKTSDNPPVVRVMWTLEEQTMLQRFWEKTGNAVVGRVPDEKEQTLKNAQPKLVGFAINPGANNVAQFDNEKLWTTPLVTRDNLSKEEREKLRAPFRRNGLKVIAITWCGDELAALTDKQIFAWTQLPEDLGNPGFSFPSKGAKGIAGSACGTYLLAFAQGEDGKGASLYQRNKRWMAILEKAHSSPIVAASFSPERDGAKIMLTADKSGKVKVWDPVSGAKINEFELGEDLTSLDCGSYADGKYIVVAGTNGKFHSYGLEKKE